MNIDEVRKGFLSECVGRAWGCYVSTFSVEGFKTKVFIVKPGQRLSLQSHSHRSEMWSVVSGEGICTVGDKKFHVSKDSYVHIPKDTLHRIENVSESSDLVISEVQVGDYLSEDDIVRYADDYGRDS